MPQPAHQASPIVAPTVADIAARADRREPLSVVFFGGSLTWGANASDPNATSYRGLMMRWLREKYPHTSFAFHDAAIGGTGSQLGLFRLDRDVFARRPDLVFLDFTVNDGLYDVSEPSLALYERLLREILASRAAVIPVLMCGYAEITSPSAPPPLRYAAHRKLAEAYGLIPADTMGAARAAVAAGRIAADRLYPFENDRIHPDDVGYQLFFEATRDAWMKACLAIAPTTVPAAPVYPDHFRCRTRLVLAESPLPTGWARTKTYRTAMWHDGLSSRWMEDVACARAGAAPLEVPFHGSFVALLGERNGITPPFRVWLDGQPIAHPNAKTTSSLRWRIDTSVFASLGVGGGNLLGWTVIADHLAEGAHRLRIAPEFAEAAPGAELRIESICSAGSR